MLFLYFITCFAILVYYYFTRNFNYWKSLKVPGPKPVPFFGNLMDLAMRNKNTGVVHDELYNEYPNEKVVGIHRMTTPSLLLRDLDIIKHVMIKDFDQFSDRGISFSEQGLGKNLFHADGETWRVLRHRLSPIFTPAKLRNMTYLLVQQADKILNYVEDISRSQSEHDIQILLQRYTMSTIATCAFGLELDTLQKEQMDMLRKIDSLVFTPSYANELDMMYPGILTKLNASLFPMEVSNFFENLVRKVVADRNDAPIGRNDFMDMILEMKQKKDITGKSVKSDQNITLYMSDEIIAAQAFVFYVAGYETSATTTSYTLYELAKNPDVQKKILEEIDEVLAKSTEPLTYDRLKEFTYLDKVFKETLRFYPIVDPLQRRATVNYKIPGTTVTLEKGQMVVISVRGIHHDPKYYPDPEKFDPERFSPEAEQNRHPCAYLPFGEGQRNCIGKRFAQLQSSIFLVKFLSRFRVELSKNSKPLKYSPKRVLLAPDSATMLNIIPREKN